MKQKLIIVLTTVVSLSGIGGCANQERLKTYEVAEMSNGQVENRYVQEYVDQEGKKVVNKQMTRERHQCLDKNGKPLPAKSAADCMKRKGKVVDEVYQEENIRRSR